MMDTKNKMPFRFKTRFVFGLLEPNDVLFLSFGVNLNREKTAPINSEFLGNLLPLELPI
jgi:hypothetical protein